MPRNCSCCNSPDHTIRTCDSVDMTRTIDLFKHDMQRIFRQDTLTDLGYHFTRETAAQMSTDNNSVSVCHLQRAIQSTTHLNPIKSLKHMVARMVPNVRRIPSTKYELVCTLMHHYMNHGEGQLHLADENPIITQIYMDYLTRGHIGNMSYEDNIAQLELEVSPIVVEQLETIRANHIRDIAICYRESTNEEKLEFVIRGVRDIRNHSSGWLRQRPGAFPHPTVFGNVLYTDIITHLPVFRDEIEQRILSIQRHIRSIERQRAGAIAREANRQQWEAERPRPQSPQHPPPGWGGIPLERPRPQSPQHPPPRRGVVPQYIIDLFSRVDLRRVHLPIRPAAAVAAAPRPTPVKYCVDSSFTSTEECPICFEKTCDAYADCNHAFCLGCIKQHVDTLIERRSAPICPMCRVDVKQVLSNEGQRRPEVVDLTA